MKYKFCFGVLFFLTMANIASADVRVHDMQGSSYPNPSIEGQEVTFNFTINLTNTETGEIYPANGGYFRFFPFELTKPITDGIKSKTVSGLSVGKPEIFVTYWWWGENIMDADLYIDHTVLPYVQDFNVTCDYNNPMTITATFDFVELDDPKFHKPSVNLYVDVYDRVTYTEFGFGTPITNEGVTTWTTPELLPGKYEISAMYFTENYGDSKGVDFTRYINGNGNEIPEFPSMVAPIAIILGFIAVFSRKKE